MGHIYVYTYTRHTLAPYTHTHHAGHTYTRASHTEPLFLYTTFFLLKISHHFIRIRLKSANNIKTDNLRHEISIQKQNILPPGLLCLKRPEIKLYSRSTLESQLNKLHVHVHRYRRHKLPGNSYSKQTN